MTALTFSLLLLAAQQARPSIELETTTLGDYRAEVGHLAVPENRANEDSRTIRLALARLKSTAAEPGAPLVYLPGGPGNGATDFARSAAWKPYLEQGDVILMDPRGVGRSEPDLVWESLTIRPELFFTDRETAVAHMVEVCTQAAADLAKNGVDLAGYNSNELAADIRDLAAALGYERVKLMGHSYGTHLGLAIIERYPGFVERFVSVGTAGTDDMFKLPGELDSSLQQLSDLVARDEAVGEELGDLYGTFERLVERLAEEPLAVPLGTTDGGELSVQLGPFGLQLLVLADLGDTSDLPVLPRLVRSLEARDPSLVAWFLQKRLNQFARLPVMMLAVRGASGASSERWKRIRREGRKSPFGIARCLFSPEADVALGVRDVGDDFREPVESDVPTLFVSGTLDAHTPPAQAEAVRRGFANSGHLIVTNGGHEDLIPNPDVQRSILAFLGGQAPRDATIQAPPLRFAPLEGPALGFDHPALAALR